MREPHLSHTSRCRVGVLVLLVSLGKSVPMSSSPCFSRSPPGRTSSMAQLTRSCTHLLPSSACRSRIRWSLRWVCPVEYVVLRVLAPLGCPANQARNQHVFALLPHGARWCPSLGFIHGWAEQGRWARAGGVVRGPVADRRGGRRRPRWSPGRAR